MSKSISLRSDQTNTYKLKYVNDKETDTKWSTCQ